MDVAETVVDTPQAEAPLSIAEHAEAFSPEAIAEATPASVLPSDAPKEGESTERDASGKFKPRHRARSQQANAEDVEAINGYTKRIKEFEAKNGADIVQKPGESQRVYEMRRRAELLERQQQAKPEPKPAPRVEAPKAEPKAVDDPEPVEDDPKYTNDYGKFLKDQARWAARDENRNIQKAERAAAEQRRLAESHEATAKSWGERVTAAKGIHGDFEAIAFGPTHIPAGSFVDAWIMEHKAGALVLYSLQQNPAEQIRILGLPILEQAEELSLLGQRLTSSRQTAVSSGAASTPRTHNPPPRPPTPERTEAQRASDIPPPTDGSLSIAEHSKAFGHKARR